MFDWWFLRWYCQFQAGIGGFWEKYAVSEQFLERFEIKIPIAM
jgi:hypothetical protein